MTLSDVVTLLRRRPSGLVSWRYAWPPALRDPRVVVHRKLWLTSRTRGWMPAWLVLEVARWVAWQVLRLPAMQRRSLPASDAAGRRIFAIARRWSIPPYEIARHGLAERPLAALSLVYDVETAAFHRLCNGDAPQTRRDTRLLGDKVATATACTAAGIPVAPIAAVVPRGSETSLDAQLADMAPVHCKTRSGHGAHGAFSVWRDGRGLAGRTADGTPLESEIQLETAWHRLLAGDDAVVQPLLATHPALAPMAAAGELVTLRFISRRTAHGYETFHAVLEIPVPAGLAESWRMVPIPIDAATGDLLPWPSAAAYVAGASELVDQLRRLAPATMHVPDFDRIRTWSFAAHALVPSLWAVAWDWAITPDGPLLLEGNAGWSLAMPQILRDEPMAHYVGRDPGAASG